MGHAKNNDIKVMTWLGTSVFGASKKWSWFFCWFFSKSQCFRL